MTAIACGGLYSQIDALRAERDRLSAQLAAAASRLRLLAEQVPDASSTDLQASLRREARSLVTHP